MTEDSPKTSSLLQVIGGILGLLNSREKRCLILMFFLGIVDSLAEVLSVGLVLPYAYVLLDTEKAATYPVLKDLYNLSFINTQTDFVLFTSLAFLIVYGMKSAYVVFFSYYRGLLMTGIQTKYALRLYDYYMTRPYEFFFSHNPSVLQRRVSYNVSVLLNGVLLGLLDLMVSFLICLFLFLMLAAAGSITVLLSCLALILLFAVLYRKSQGLLGRIAEQYNRVTMNLHKVTLEHFRGVKDLRILNRSTESSQVVGSRLFRSNYLLVKRTYVENIPNQILEFGIVAVMLLIVSLSTLQNGSIQDVLANLSIMGAAAFKLKGSLQRVHQASARVRETQGFFNDIYPDLRRSVDEDLTRPMPKEDFRFKDCVEVKDVSYRYPGSDQNVLDGLSMRLEAGEVVGVMGPSGEGKSTLADIILGLLEPQTGEVLIDGLPMRSCVSNWQGIVGYVPQDIYLTDATILENVALGIPKERIDTKRVMEVLQAAQLEEFVSSLPLGAESVCGDNGILLSGGQKQRIGIARALYRNPQVLVFDEATSSLDADTERQFVDTINNMRTGYTMLMVAHRKESLKYCDRVLKVCKGRIEE